MILLVSQNLDHLLTTEGLPNLTKTNIIKEKNLALTTGEKILTLHPIVIMERYLIGKAPIGTHMKTNQISTLNCTYKQIISFSS